LLQLARNTRDLLSAGARHEGSAAMWKALQTWFLWVPPTLVLLVMGIFLHRRAPDWLETIGAPLRRIRSDRYRQSAKALLLTLVVAAPLPLLLWLTGRFAQQLGDRGSPLGLALGLSIGGIASSAYALSVLRWLTAERGLAQYHFRWPRPRRLALYRSVPAISLSVLPFQVLHNFWLLTGDAAADATLGRTLFVLSALGFGAIASGLLGPGRVWTLRESVLSEPQRPRQIARSTVTVYTLLLCGLALSGYFFTALTLAERMLQSLAALLAVSILHGMAVRWLMLGERRLALKRMQDKFEADSTPREGEGGEAGASEEEQITIASLGEQTRRVLRALTIVVLGALLLVIWSDVAPALAFLDNLTVWDASETLDGKSILLHISLRSILESMIVLALTFVATRNLPGLLEIGVLRRLAFDAPTRYAITSLVRYLIVIVGVIFGFALLGMRWSNLQWLAAGLTVGLGFGLQEIFANFVSGLIVLFERPFRIGDVVTIGNVEGTVARIRTRATTLVDWDNKEVVVPNKTFITERLINWTLSDSTTRVVIKLGVSYSSHPAQIQKLLLQLAGAHPLVLKEPHPTCWMTAFGASTLDFDLRVFVAEIAQRNLVRTELHFAIAECFREQGIELSFPQMDVWIRRQAPPAGEAIAGPKSPARS
jgi:potassium-dependent mechanosensitive channel